MTVYRFTTPPNPTVLPGNLAYSGSAPARTTNRMAEAAEELRKERARRALIAGCERRPVALDGECG